MRTELERRTCDECGKNKEINCREVRAGAEPWRGWYQLIENRDRTKKGGVRVPGPLEIKHDYCCFDCLAIAVEKGKNN